MATVLSPELMSALRAHLEASGEKLNSEDAKAIRRELELRVRREAPLPDKKAFIRETRPRLRNSTGQDWFGSAQRDVFAIDASMDPDVQAFHRAYRADGPLRPPTNATIAEWIRQQRVPTPSTADDMVTLEYPTADRSRVTAIEVPRDGPLGKLATLSERLHREYAWSLAGAVRFLLIDATPDVTRGARSFYPVHGCRAASRVTLVVDPSLSGDDVKAMYERARAALQRRHMPDLQAKRHAMSRENADMAVFVAQAMRDAAVPTDESDDVRWTLLKQRRPNLQDEWLSTHPGDRVRPSHWYRSARAAWEHVVHLAPLRVVSRRSATPRR